LSKTGLPRHGFGRGWRSNEKLKVKNERKEKRKKKNEKWGGMADDRAGAILPAGITEVMPPLLHTAAFFYPHSASAFVGFPRAPLNWR